MCRTLGQFEHLPQVTGTLGLGHSGRQRHPWWLGEHQGRAVQGSPSGVGHGQWGEHGVGGARRRPRVQTLLGGAGLRVGGRVGWAQVGLPLFRRKRSVAGGGEGRGGRDRREPFCADLQERGQEDPHPEGREL